MLEKQIRKSSRSIQGGRRKDDGERDTQPINQSININQLILCISQTTAKSKDSITNAVEKREGEEREKESWESAHVYRSYASSAALLPFSASSTAPTLSSNETLCVPYASIAVCRRTPSLLQMVCCLSASGRVQRKRSHSHAGLALGSSTGPTILVQYAVFSSGGLPRQPLPLESVGGASPS